MYWVLFGHDHALETVMLGIDLLSSFTICLRLANCGFGLLCNAKVC